MDEIERVAVSSSNLVSVGYDDTTRTMQVEFHGGRIYNYFQVPSHLHSDLMNSISHGHFHWAIIKKGGYAYERIA